MRLRNIKGSRDVIGASVHVVHEEQEQKGVTVPSNAATVFAPRP